MEKAEPTPPRAAMLRQAADIVEERGRSYGPPARHFARTVGAINAVLGHKLAAPLTPADWATMMILDKLAREQHSSKPDNALDVAGFRLADGTVISVQQDWSDTGPKGRFLRTVRDGACKVFLTTLSPDYNAQHHDHFHLDMGGWAKCA